MASNKIFLIVDDEIDILDILEFELEDLGFSVFKAESGNKAIELLQKEKVDFVVSDVVMNDGSGLDLLDHCAKHFKGLPVLLISGFSDLSKEEAVRKGAVGIESKLNFVKAIEDILNKYFKIND